MFLHTHAEEFCQIIEAQQQVVEVLRMAVEEVIAAGGNRSIHLDSCWLERAQAALTAVEGKEVT